MNDKQETFCREYVLDFNATQAAIRAGYAEAGSRTQGSRLLAHPNIQARIEELKGERYEKLDISKERILGELSDVAFVELEEKAPGVHEVNPRNRVDMAHKLKALEMLGRYHTMFSDKVQHSGELDFKGITVHLVGMKKGAKK